MTPTIEKIPTCNGSAKNGFEPRETVDGFYIGYYIKEGDVHLYIHACDLEDWEKGEEVMIFEHVRHMNPNTNCVFEFGSFTKETFEAYIPLHNKDEHTSEEERIIAC